MKPFCDGSSPGGCECALLADMREGVGATAVQLRSHPSDSAPKASLIVGLFLFFVRAPAMTLSPVPRGLCGMTCLPLFILLILCRKSSERRNDELCGVMYVFVGLYTGVFFWITLVVPFLSFYVVLNVSQYLL
ncbi:hypothetical protein Tc00.1047053508553.20 [Trypanosoma cruzi]|uniref:Uncharacterized protein n=1 Tax=Trypanosoma cruzi (strain CL Brener) TaxID=353153 RepID=Q4CN25_TRYCC|nr:hypothetical protein Tc00.1047053508553.20 [Trypanosoma cruzi]EAN81677.1 hypothetical protein Tc00.1047053508553.20 [Trypanosoma cruzi]|eukprot:XP_803123.1 hypothetical protein [Trypanosoma cruzi strain CL Brener]